MLPAAGGCGKARRPLYLDCAATTPLDPRVEAELIRSLREDYGNAGSRTHAYGATARRAVERARDQIARVAGASRGEVIFTSGAIGFYFAKLWYFERLYPVVFALEAFSQLSIMDTGLASEERRTDL